MHVCVVDSVAIPVGGVVSRHCSHSHSLPPSPLPRSSPSIRAGAKSLCHHRYCYWRSCGDSAVSSDCAGVYLYLSLQRQPSRLLLHRRRQDYGSSKHATLQRITTLHLLSVCCTNRWWKRASGWEGKWILCLAQFIILSMLASTYVHVHFDHPSYLPIDFHLTLSLTLFSPSFPLYQQLYLSVQYPLYIKRLAYVVGIFCQFFHFLFSSFVTLGIYQCLYFNAY